MNVARRNNNTPSKTEKNRTMIHDRLVEKISFHRGVKTNDVGSLYPYRKSL